MRNAAIAQRPAAPLQRVDADGEGRPARADPRLQRLRSRDRPGRRAADLENLPARRPERRPVRRLLVGLIPEHRRHVAGHAADVLGEIADAEHAAGRVGVALPAGHPDRLRLAMIRHEQRSVNVAVVEGVEGPAVGFVPAAVRQAHAPRRAGDRLGVQSLCPQGLDLVLEPARGDRRLPVDILAKVEPRPHPLYQRREAAVLEVTDELEVGVLELDDRIGRPDLHMLHHRHHAEPHPSPGLRRRFDVPHADDEMIERPRCRHVG